MIYSFLADLLVVFHLVFILYVIAGALLILILFSNITLNSGNKNSESDLLNNNSEFEIEEILENDEDPATEE